MLLITDRSREKGNLRIVDDIHIGSFQLESGVILKDVTLRYELIGRATAPVILVCHALTGDHQSVGTEESPGWWRGLIGPGGYIDTEKYRILTFNVLGGCNGSTGPLSINPETNQLYQATFPFMTIRDMVHAQFQALQKMNINDLEAVIGGSLGGMQAMEWGLLYPDMIDKIMILAATPFLSDYGIAFNYIAESIIKNDLQWNNGFYQKNTYLKGLEIARMVGMVTYRSHRLFMTRFQRQKELTNTFSVNTYLRYKGETLAKRFDANSYVRLLQAMNHHDIGRNRGHWKKACKNFKSSVLVVSYDKDLIYDPLLVKKFSENIPYSIYKHVKTDYGHDGFLTEFDKWAPFISEFLAYQKIHR